MATTMTMIRLPVLLAAVSLAAPALAGVDPSPQRRGDQMRAFQARREGRALSIKEIERRVVPTMPSAQYLGFDFDSAAVVYTLKFLRDGTVIWVDVDGQSGQIIGRTGR